jgi:F-type H+-transporting ATPase subunit b
MISINATLILQLISFLVLLLILNRIFIRPVKRLMEERQAHAQSQREEADRLQDQAVQGESDYRRQRHEAVHAVGEDLSRIRSEVEEEAMALLDHTRDEAEALTRRLAREVEVQVDQARRELQAEIQVLARQMAERVLARSVEPGGGGS